MTTVKEFIEILKEYHDPSEEIAYTFFTWEDVQMATDYDDDKCKKIWSKIADDMHEYINDDMSDEASSKLNTLIDEYESKGV